MAKLDSNSKNANYKFEKKDSRPKGVYGQGSYANLPQKPMFMGFSGKHDYRDGIVNGFTCEISEISHIEENEK